ncbi:ROTUNDIFOLIA like 8 [Rhynchospora pubera]|uniref:ROTUNDIFOLIA like 8 n=1 Tax=Rhynchospora pubera TaxID=906938 RepID=A0AAV8DZH5_9POAL|nr:ROTUNDIFOLIA like 8 [Rhynchospora pubera]
MELYLDEKWKLSKKGSRKEVSNSVLSKGGSSSSSGGNGKGRSMARSISSRCSSLVKEQRARFYIMRRCVTMLVCWREY